MNYDKVSIRDVVVDGWQRRVTLESEVLVGERVVGSVYCVLAVGNKWMVKTKSSLVLPRGARFSSKEDAAEALALAWRVADANPVHGSVRDLLTSHARDLHGEQAAAMSTLRGTYHRRRVLLGIARELGMPDVEFLCKDASIPDNAKRLMEFINEHSDDIYGYFGKDWGRTLLGLVASTIRETSPEAADLL